MADPLEEVGVSATASAGASGVQSPEIPPGANLSTQERRAWQYLTGALRQAGVKHITAGMPLVMVCKMWCNWQRLEQDWARVVEQNNGSTVFFTSNGNAYHHPAGTEARRARQDLLRVLPEAALTIPSLTLVESKAPSVAPTDDLFAMFADFAQNPAGQYSAGAEPGKTLQ